MAETVNIINRVIDELQKYRQGQFNDDVQHVKNNVQRAQYFVISRRRMLKEDKARSKTFQWSPIEATLHGYYKIQLRQFYLLLMLYRDILGSRQPTGVFVATTVGDSNERNLAALNALIADMTAHDISDDEEDMEDM